MYASEVADVALPIKFFRYDRESRRLLQIKARRRY